MLHSIKFEVFGKVQGVYFRAYTQKKAKELQLVGWVLNTERNTVLGEAQGQKTKIQEMRHWLTNVGSPSSKIDKCEIVESSIEVLTYTSFIVRKGAQEL